MDELRGIKRIPLIGRGKLISEIEETYKNLTKPTLWYLEGDGGIGKTTILEHVRVVAKEDRVINVANDIIDLYHVEYQTPQRLARRIAEVLSNVVDFRLFIDKLRLMWNQIRQIG